jgi:hypothetical protein
MPRTLFSISAEESALLMMFLDCVFPLQYPMYTPGTVEGGRGWLLTALLQTGALYHASLAFSTYHRRMIMPTNNKTIEGAALVQQEIYLENCITLMKQYAQRSSHDRKGLGIGITVSQLIYFEVLYYLLIFGFDTDGFCKAF